MASAQEQFDLLYITSVEIRKRLGVTRPALTRARERGELPPHININDSQIYIWQRDAVEPYIQAWADRLQKSRGIA